MKLGDHTPEYLIRSALDETLAMGKLLDKVLAKADGISVDDRLLLSAYVGSIGARCSVAEDELRERAIAAEDRLRETA